MKKIAFLILTILFSVTLFGQKSAEEYLSDADGFYEQGKYEMAARTYLRVLMAFATDEMKYDAYIGMARSKIEMRDYEGAKSDLNDAVKLIPEKAEAYIKRAESKTHMRDWAAAIRDYTLAIEIDSSNGKIFYERGLLHKKINQKYDACQDFKKASELGVFEAFKKAEKTCRKFE